MIWCALLFTGAIAAIEGPVRLRSKQWKALWVEGLLLGLALAMAAMVQFHIWLQFDPLAPIKLVFTPLSNWIYSQL